MDTKTKTTRFKTTPVALAVMLSGYSAMPLAIEFDWGDVEGSFNSQLSVGSSWRVEDTDPKNIGNGNGGPAGNTPTGDDGNLNYEKWDAYTQTFKGIHDLTLQYDTFGIFARGKYWYDYALEKNKVPHGSGTNAYVPNEVINDSDFNNLTKAKGAALLDAYVFAGFDIGDVALDLRVGKQVVNWGESSYIQGGINVVNPVDAAAFRRPGAEVKEGLLPVNMVFANIGLTDSLSVEAFYQLEFEPTVIDSCGTYFSTADFQAEGCDVLVVDPSLGAPDKALFDQGLYAERGTDEVASDDGQYGIAFKYYADSLNGTEFGLYYMNYHSRLPYASAEAGLIDRSSFDPSDPTAYRPFLPVGLAPPGYNAAYHSAYPEDIQLFGLSFNTTVSEWAVSGEVSHRLDMPLQINGADLLGTALTGGLSINQTTGNRSPLDDIYAAAAPGETVDGFDRFDYTQAQFTLIKFFDKALGTDRITTVAEIGYGHVWDLDESEGAIKYGRATTFGNSYDQYGDDDGFTTTDSVGYRIAIKADYRDVFSGVDLSPSVAWSHDVYGYSPEPQGSFQEGRTGVNVALKADYLKTYTMAISYTGFDGDYNPLSDRDYASVAFGVSF